MLFLSGRSLFTQLLSFEVRLIMVDRRAVIYDRRALAMTFVVSLSCEMPTRDAKSRPAKTGGFASRREPDHFSTRPAI